MNKILVLIIFTLNWAKSSESSPQITLAEALIKALEKEQIHKQSSLELEKAKLSDWLNISALLPKVSLRTGYTRNFPEVKTNLLGDTKAHEDLTRQVAGILADQGKAGQSSELLKQAELLQRRDDSDLYVFNPKHVFEASLNLQIPIFNGPDLMRVFKNQPKDSQTKLNAQKMKILYDTALAYAHVVHCESMLSIKKRALEKNGGIFQKAEVKEAMLDVRLAKEALSNLIGLEDFVARKVYLPKISLNAKDLYQNAMNRPDFIQKKAELEKDDYSHILPFLPVITLDSSANFTSNNKGLLKEHWTYAIGINARMNLFDGGVSLIGLKAMSLKRQEDELVFKKLERDIESSIKNRVEKIELLTLKEQALKAKPGFTAEIDHEKIKYDLDLTKISLLHESGLLTPDFIQ